MKKLEVDAALNDRQKVRKIDISTEVHPRSVETCKKQVLVGRRSAIDSKWRRGLIYEKNDGNNKIYIRHIPVQEKCKKIVLHTMETLCKRMLAKLCK